MWGDAAVYGVNSDVASACYTLSLPDRPIYDQAEKERSYELECLNKDYF